jgi:transcriptional regulator with XRE-family HTH domain/predicted nucleotidyltransferase
MEPGELIAQVRTRAGLTQAALARRAGTSQSMVARYETGRSSPTIDALRRLVRAAGQELILTVAGGAEDAGRATGADGLRVMSADASQVTDAETARMTGADTDGVAVADPNYSHAAASEDRDFGYDQTGYGDLSRGSVSAIWRRRLAVRAIAGELGVRKIRVFGPAALGGDPDVVDLLVDFPVARRGMFPLLRMAIRIEEVTEQRVEVWVPPLMTQAALHRARTEAMPL